MAFAFLLSLRALAHPDGRIDEPGKVVGTDAVQYTIELISIEHSTTSEMKQEITLSRTAACTSTALRNKQLSLVVIVRS